MCATASRPCGSRRSAYVLPRTGQQGIPVISVNTRSVAVELYRISDRNLIDTIAGVGYANGDFQQSLDRDDIERLKNSRGVAVWSGDLAVEKARAQCRGHDRVPGRPGGRRIFSPASMSWWRSRPRKKNLDNNYEFARDPVVHRLRPRAHRVLRQ